MGLDGAWVSGLLLSTPWACAGSSTSAATAAAAIVGAGGAAAQLLAEGCQPAATANLSVYVTDAPLALGSGQALPASVSGGQCAAGVAALAGQPTWVDCGGFLQGVFCCSPQCAAACCVDPSINPFAVLSPNHHLSPAPLPPP